MTSQLEMWENTTLGIDPVWEQLNKLAEKQGNLRRGIFHRYDVMQKEIIELRKEIYKLQNILHVKKEDIFKTKF